MAFQRKFVFVICGALLFGYRQVKAMMDDVQTVAPSHLFTQRISLTGKKINHIMMSGAGSLTIFQTEKGEEEYFSITGDERLKDPFNLQMQENYGLYVNSNNNSSPLSVSTNVYHLGLRDIKKITLQDCIKAQFGSKIVLLKLEINLTDSTEIVLTQYDINVRELKVIGRGKSIITLAGNVPFQELYFFDYARYDALCVKSNNIYVTAYDSVFMMLCLEAYGSGKNRKLAATLRGELFDNSTMRYIGNPRINQLFYRNKSGSFCTNIVDR